MPWHLVDGDARNEAHPRSFFVPSSERRSRLVVGDLVKLLVEDADGRGERMWVQITEAEHPSFAGTLENSPSFVELQPGDPIAFEARHIIAVAETVDSLGYAASEDASVARRVILDDIAPGVVAWEPDAGCFFLFVGDESEPEVRDLGTFVAQTLGEMTDRFPELAAVFSAAREPGFWKRSDDGQYVRLARPR